MAESPASDEFLAKLCEAIAKPDGAEALVKSYDPAALVEYLLKRLIHEAAQKDTNFKALLAKVITSGGVVRCAETNIEVAPDDVQSHVVADGRLVNSVSAANDGMALTSIVLGATVSPPSPPEALQILRAFIAEHITRDDKPLKQLRDLLPPDTTDVFLLLVLNHAGKANDPDLQSAAKAVLNAHHENVRQRAERVKEVLSRVKPPNPPPSPALRDSTSDRGLKRKVVSFAPDPAVKRERLDGPIDELPPEDAGPIQKTDEGRWPRSDGFTVMTTKFGGPCKGCPRRNVAGRTVIAPKEEPDGTTKWACSLCVMNKTSAAVYTEVHKAQIAAQAGPTGNISAFF